LLVRSYSPSFPFILDHPSHFAVMPATQIEHVASTTWIEIPCRVEQRTLFVNQGCVREDSMWAAEAE
jgi:hypothetical protein